MARIAGVIAVVSAASLALAAAAHASPRAGVTHVDLPDGTHRQVVTGEDDPAGRLTARAATGQQDRAVLVCKFSDGSAPEPQYTTAYLEQLFGAGAYADTATYPRTLRAYFNEASYGAIDFVPAVASMVTIGTKSSYGLPVPEGEWPSETALQNMAQDCVNANDAAINFSGVDGLDLVLPIAGRDFGANLGGTKFLTMEGTGRVVPVTWIPIPISNLANDPNRALWVHEIGHSFGLAHIATGKHDADAVIHNAVTGPWDPMGFPSGYCFWAGGGDPTPSYGCNGTYYAAASRGSDYLGWIPAARERTVPATARTVTPGTKKTVCKRVKGKKGKKKKRKCRTITTPAKVGAYPTTTLTVERSGLPPANGNPILVKVPRSTSRAKHGDYYGVEVRNSVDAGLFEAEHGSTGVVVTLVRPAYNSALGSFAEVPVLFDGAAGPGSPGSPPNNLYTADRVSTFTPGETFTSPDGLATIQVLSATGSGFTVRITNRRG